MAINDAMDFLIGYERLIGKLSRVEADRARKSLAKKMQVIIDQHDEMSKGIAIQTPAILAMADDIGSLKEKLQACEAALKSCKVELCYAILGDGTECSDWFYKFDQQKVEAALDLINQKD